MTRLNIHEAKTHLSRYIAKVQAGETILLCKNGTPVAQITPLSKQNKPKRKLFGLGKGMGKVTKAFLEPLTDEELPG